MHWSRWNLKLKTIDLKMQKRKKITGGLELEKSELTRPLQLAAQHRRLVAQGYNNPYQLYQHNTPEYPTELSVGKLYCRS